MTSTEKHYWELSEIYLAMYQDSISPRNKIAIAMGVIVEMESELVKFQIKNPSKTDIIQTQENRLQILKEAIDSFTITACRNSQIKVFLQQYHNKNMALQNENDELKKELTAIKKAING